MIAVMITAIFFAPFWVIKGVEFVSNSEYLNDEPMICIIVWFASITCGIALCAELHDLKNQ